MRQGSGWWQPATPATDASAKEDVGNGDRIVR